MKPAPTLRETKRYIVFAIDTDKSFPIADVQEAVHAALRSFLGELGIAKAKPMFLKETYKEGKFIVKVSHKWVDECKSALILIKTIKKTPVVLHSIITSGTLKKARSHL